MSRLIILPTPAPGTGSGYWVTMENFLTQLTTNDQLIEDRFEATFNHLFGQGVVYGSYVAPLLAAGSGLNVTIVAHISLIGFALKFAQTHTLAVPASQTSVWLWEFQDSTDTVPHYVATTTSANPSTDTENPAILLGTCVTGATSVTSVNNTRTEVLPPAKGQVEESFTQGGTNNAQNFNATDSARSNGTVVTVTVSKTPNPGSVVNVLLDRQDLVMTDDWTISGSVVTFLAGAQPMNGEKVRVRYVPQ